MNSFTLDGRCSLDWNVGLSGTGVWDAPVRRGESFSIPGRNGAVWLDEDVFENISVVYPCWIAEEFANLVDDFRAFLMAHGDKYYRLTDTYHPEEFRLARHPGPFQATPGAVNKWGRFDVVFDCDPRRFLKSGEKAIEKAGITGNGFTVYNPTHFASTPVFKIATPAQGQRINFGSTTLIINVSGTDLVYDCETMTATLLGRQSAGAVTVSGDPPKFYPGNTNIITTNLDIANYDIFPRWWTI